MDQEQHPPKPFLDGECLEERLAVGDREVEVGGDDVRELTGVGNLGEKALDRLAREARLAAQLYGSLAQLTDQRHVRRRLRIERRHFLRVAHGRHEVIVVLHDAQRDRSALAVEHQLHPGGAALHLHDPGDRSDRVEDFWRRGVHVLALGGDERNPLGPGERGLDGREGARPTGGDRDRHAGEQHRLSKRNYGKGKGCGHSVAPWVARVFSGPCRQPPSPAHSHNMSIHN